jgi:tripartite-type tricarboxylate transporter receptor subunit TctC
VKLQRRRFLYFAARGVSLAPFSRMARAQAYPSRRIQIIVGFPPGGGSDILARLIGAWLSERLGHPVIIENRPGAATDTATEAVARAAPAFDYPQFQMMPEVGLFRQNLNRWNRL